MSEVGQEEHLLSEFEDNKARLNEPTIKDGIVIGAQQDPQQF